MAIGEWRINTRSGNSDSAFVTTCRRRCFSFLDVATPPVMMMSSMLRRFIGIINERNLCSPGVGWDAVGDGWTHAGGARGGWAFCLETMVC